MRPKLFGYRATKKLYFFFCAAVFPPKYVTSWGDDVIKETVFNVKRYYKRQKSLQSEIEDKETTFDDQLKQYFCENMVSIR